MKAIKCPCESCRKEVRNPIIVTNFSNASKKETYYACPYCLTKIETPLNESNCTPDNTNAVQPENLTTQKRASGQRHSSQAVMMEKLETLEKQKTDLLAELDKLRTDAMQKICNLQDEVDALRKEADILKKLTA
ncbi:MAG: hypothetical protein NWF06_03265 [Candidatus Bathyarchaeota archaeon]|nr:hypothetical protein [Candidatus Bathyarchaeum sp.]